MSHSPPSDVAVRSARDARSEALLRATLGSIDLGVMVTDLEHITLAINHRFGQIWGADPSKLVELDVEEVRAQVKSRIPNHSAWERNLEEVYQNPHHTQEDEFVLISPRQIVKRRTTPILDSNGDPIARLWTFEDITAEYTEKRMGRIMTETTILFDPDPRAVYESITQSLADFYGSLALLSVQKAEYLEFRSVKGPGEEMARQMGGNNLEDSFCQFCLAEKGPVIVQDSRLSPHTAKLLPTTIGLTRYAGVPVYGPEGSVIGTLCILDGHSDEVLTEQDTRFLSVLAMRISAELERESQLRRLQSDLLSTSEELRTALDRSIENEKLAVAGTLSASVAHDIRNILAAVSLELEMGDGSPVETLAKVKDHLDRFHVMSHQLLSYVRPKHVVLEPVDLAESLKRVTNLLQRTMEMNRVKVMVSVDDSVPFIRADASRMDHVIVNLMLNAAQAMKSGGTLQLALKLEENKVQLQFADSGSGMQQDDVDYLFEPFKSRRRGGFGLGLYSVKRIVQESRGEIKIDSEPGKGTCITLSWEAPCPLES